MTKTILFLRLRDTFPRSLPKEGKLPPSQIILCMAILSMYTIGPSGRLECSNQWILRQEESSAKQLKDKFNFHSKSFHHFSQRHCTNNQLKSQLFIGSTIPGGIGPKVFRCPS